MLKELFKNSRWELFKISQWKLFKISAEQIIVLCVHVTNHGLGSRRMPSLGHNYNILITHEVNILKVS